MQKLIIATNNQGKVLEIKAILSGFFDEILSLKDIGLNVDVVEDGASFYENARKKAGEISKLVDGAVLADDSGLCVDALGGAPGIFSARFAGEGATDAQNNQKLLRELEGKKDRGARFVCALVLAEGGEELLSTEGEVRGTIIDEERGSGGFGYDPLFYVEAYKKTFGEIAPEVKNAISHRSRALARLREALEKEG